MQGLVIISMMLCDMHLVFLLFYCSVWDRRRSTWLSFQCTTRYATCQQTAV